MEASATPSAQLTFFAEFLQTTGIWDPSGISNPNVWLQSSPPPTIANACRLTIGTIHVCLQLLHQPLIEPWLKLATKTTDIKVFQNQYQWGIYFFFEHSGHAHRLVLLIRNSNNVNAMS
jgi:hypothetical protein